MIDYSFYKCSKCMNKAVGCFVDKDYDKTYYCNSHFFARSKVADAELERQYDRQWGNKDWYRKLYPEKFVDTLTPPETDQRFTQSSLF